jgi:hypothetical protein
MDVSQFDFRAMGYTEVGDQSDLSFRLAVPTGSNRQGQEARLNFLIDRTSVWKRARLRVVLKMVCGGEGPVVCSGTALLGCELFYGADHSIARAARVGRVNLVVVSGLRLEVHNTYAENRVRMALIQPNVRFRGLAQVLGVRAIVHNGKVLRRSPRVAGRPPDNGQIVSSHFDLRSFDDPDVRRFLGRGNELS